ncbi:MAG: DUF3052 domain-containing protein [Acidobacteriota bacterium]
MPAGYSGTPLAKKLGITDGCRLAALYAPAHYRRLLDPLPLRVRILSRLSRDLDLVHLFVMERRRLADRLPACLSRIRQNGGIWVSWPKKASKVETDMTEDVVREVALPLGLVDVKVCAVDEVWSGLKLVIRKELRR